MNRYVIFWNWFCFWDKYREKLNYNRLFKIKNFVYVYFVFFVFIERKNKFIYWFIVI